MKFITLLVLCFTNAIFAQDNYESLSAKYESGALPTQEKLIKSQWMLVKMVSNYALTLNEEHKDYLDEDGVKNRDGSQMLWEFKDDKHALLKFTLSKFNFLILNNNLHFQAKLDSKSNSLEYTFSGYSDGKNSDIYYIQNCRISSEERLICPLTLKVTEAALLKYKDPRLYEANNQVTIIQEFKSITE